jgi:hypothetical protein
MNAAIRALSQAARQAAAVTVGTRTMNRDGVLDPPDMNAIIRAAARGAR